jgi:hypothetical protein
MSKVLVWISIVMLAVYVVKTQYLTSKTWEPFRDGCIAGGGTEAQCNCLSDYLHERFSDLEVERIMKLEKGDSAFETKVEQTVMAGTLACKAGG